MANRHVLIFMGPQGSGKGTQAQLFARAHNFVVISTGNLLRQEAQKATERGRAIQAAVTSGSLVADEVTEAVLREYFKTLPADQRVILDGYPRTLAQAERLDHIAQVSVALYITLTDDEAIRRIAGREQCPDGHTYNVFFAPPRQEGVCDHDGLPLRRRDDDTEDATRRRLALHAEESAHILEYYRKQQKLVTVSGADSIEVVSHRIMNALEPHVSS